MLLDGLKDVRSRQPSTADVEIVERWITRVVGIEASLDAITDWDSAEAYEVNALHPGEALRRLFPTGLDGSDFEADLRRLENELARAAREREREPPTRSMTADEGLVDVLTGHGSARFVYLDVRGVNAWRSERLPWGINIPLERLAEEAPEVFQRDTDLVVYGDDDASTEAAARLLTRVGFKRTRTIPGGFQWFSRQGWQIETGPGR